MRRVWPILLWLACGIAIADVSVGPLQKRDTPVVIEHKAGDVVNAVFVDADGQWKFLADKHFERSESRTIFAAPPGQYLLTTGDSKIVQIVEESQPHPKPSPDPPGPNPPNPDPNPAPSPGLKINWAVWVYEQTDSVDQIEQTNVRQSIETRNYLAARGIRLAAYDDEQDAARAEQFRSVLSKLPGIVLVQDAANFRAFEAPKTLDELKKIVAEVAGE
jgi:hypothetical protein